MVVWPSDPPFRVEPWSQLAQGGSSNVSLLHLTSHTGTHVDAPSHFIPGAASVDQVDPQLLVGPARLFNLEGERTISLSALHGLDLAGVSRALFRTRNSYHLQDEDFWPEFTYLTEEGARFLVERGASLVGVDYLSIEAYQNPDHPTHRILLGAGVVVIEGLDLSQVEAGDYELMCLPLKLKDADGAPTRVFLREL